MPTCVEMKVVTTWANPSVSTQSDGVHVFPAGSVPPMFEAASMNEAAGATAKPADGSRGPSCIVGRSAATLVSVSSDAAPAGNGKDSTSTGCCVTSIGMAGACRGCARPQHPGRLQSSGGVASLPGTSP